MQIFELGKNHSHETHEEKRHCVLSFGECWYVYDKPSKNGKSSNFPNGVYKPDMDSRSFLK